MVYFAVKAENVVLGYPSLRIFMFAGGCYMAQEATHETQFPGTMVSTCMFVVGNTLRDVGHFSESEKLLI